MFAEEEHRSEQPLNNEEGNIRDGEFCVDLNEIWDNKYELKRIMDELRSKLRKIKVLWIFEEVCMRTTV